VFLPIVAVSVEPSPNRYTDRWWLCPVGTGCKKSALQRCPSLQTMLPAPEPDHRPRRSRRTARVLILDPDGAVFMWHDSDPWAEGKPQFWITAGGGVDEGESDRAAAIREVHEEVGLLADADDLVGPLAERTVVHGYSDVVQQQEEVFFALRADGLDPDTRGHTLEEQTTLQGFRWWTPAELDATAELVFPAGLAPLVRLAHQALNGRTPAQIVQLPADQESTVDAGSTDGHARMGDIRAVVHGGQMTSSDWDERYRAEQGLWGDDVTWALRPILESLDAERGEGRRVVDLASGSGRHALWLARHGWQVSAVDFSAEAIAQGRTRVDAGAEAVDWQIADVRDWEPGSPVDLVLVAFLHLHADDFRRLLVRALRWLTPTGSLVYVGHARENLEHGTGGPPRPEVLPTVGNLAATVDGLEVRMLGHVRRPVAGHRDAVDVVAWASPWSVDEGDAP
jgi:8-oxo-dGTP pyrophosphatase MutT (NUDIX family)/SAM-dependent methyltransferase